MSVREGVINVFTMENEDNAPRKISFWHWTHARENGHSTFGRGGFRLSGVLDLLPGKPDEHIGRGIFLMRAFMDEVEVSPGAPAAGKS